MKEQGSDIAATANENNRETFNPRTFLPDYGQEGVFLARRRRRHGKADQDYLASSVLEWPDDRHEKFRESVQRHCGFKVETRTAIRGNVAVGTAWEDHAPSCACNRCVTTVSALMAYPRLMFLLVAPARRQILQRAYRGLPPDGALRGPFCTAAGQYSLRQALDRIVELDEADDRGGEGPDEEEDWSEDDDLFPPRPAPRELAHSAGNASRDAGARRENSGDRRPVTNPSGSCERSYC
eukprot:jgi/Mesvir1/24964/Mv16934-RA.1